MSDSSPTPTPDPVVTCATGGGAAGTCVVGDTGPGGGKVFYVNWAKAGTTGSRYMEAAANTWSGASADPNIVWCSNTFTSGTFSEAIGAGESNTDTMVAKCSSGAANSVRAYTGGGVSWFLPSLYELAELYTQRTVVGGFAADFYWSSSRLSPDWAPILDFDNGNLDWGSNEFAALVRPVRAF